MTSSLQNYASIRYWIVSAWLPEQQILRQTFERETDRGPVCVAGKVGLLCTGVGSVRGAALVAKALALTQASGGQPEAVLFVATAGCYSSDIAAGSTHVCSEVVWTDGDLLSKSSYLPRADQGVIRCLEGASLFRERGLVTVSTPGITTDERLAQQLAQWGGLENLELYGVAEAAQAAGVAWGAVLGVSNRVGAQSHSEWKQHHEMASQAAQSKLFELYLKERLST